MATPEKKKQASIASFFSPVSRSVTASAASKGVPTSVVEEPQPSPLTSKPDKAASPTTQRKTPPNSALKRKIKSSDPAQNSEDVQAASPTPSSPVQPVKPPPSVVEQQPSPLTITPGKSAAPAVQAKSPPTSASNRNIKPSDSPPSSELPKPTEQTSPTSPLQPVKLNLEGEAKSPTVSSPKAKKRKTKSPAVSAPPPASAFATSSAPESDLTDVASEPREEAQPTTTSEVVVIDDEDSSDSTKGTTAAKNTQEDTSKARPKRLAATAGRKQEDVAVDVKQPARKRAKAAAPSPPDGPPPVTKPALSAAQQHKHDVYLQKLTDLEELYVSLALGTNRDEVLQEIYGAHTDVGLNLSTAEHLEPCRTEVVTECSHASKAWSTVPPLAKSFIARRVQGSMESLSALAGTIHAEWLGWLKVPATECFNVSMLEMEIKSMAERVSYGAKPKKAHMFQDTTPRAMWVWEVGAVESYFDDDAVKVIRRVRKQRKRTGQTIKTLDKIVAMAQEPATDDSKLSLEESKASRFYVAVELELQKAQKRLDLEKQKVAEKRLKAQQQFDKDEAKRVDLEHKRKEKDEAKKKLEALAKEKEDLELQRRRQTWGSFLKKDADANTTDELSRDKAAQAHAQMDAIDQQLGLGGAHASDSKHPPALPPSSSSSGARVVTFGSWSSQRHRHPTLGVKKLLQFHDNYRPAYWGTYSKKARTLRRGRRPFATVPSLDYTVESDLEWEEDDEMGESLSGRDSDDDNGDEEDRLDYGDKWLAYEDEVDYIDERPADDDDLTVSTHKKVAEHHHRSSKLVKQVPRIITDAADELDAYAIVVLVERPNLVSPLLKVNLPAVEDAAVIAPVVATPAAPSPGVLPVEEGIVPPKQPSGITTFFKPKPVT
ncbi:hypothetical protein H257_01147 [Aphanomyces astaci]|uniref:Chromatin assembly factor 1 subunit A dimerization domain-containing protein n=1 Tax=Aphanomyces astaci TaxID=112090 RepID=W4H6Z0_APHAT|nr:hypothetical protein H257_01147 [Aphanomyces astaci]ETV87647.1 hypothetical protein H257_01147 [Aphanomyces astaci]|eukprot:XP_009822510.1 hypothetical protein H257_01147 [Aphanomyces astaci]